MSFEEPVPDIRADGHVVLLIETSPGHRTFSDYPNISICLNTVLNMYEEYRDAFNEDLGGDLKDFQKWLDDFHNIYLLEFNKDIGRYKGFSREKMKLLFENNDCNNSPKPNGIMKSIDKTTNRLNGFSINGNGHIEQDDSDESSNWDD